jgi:Tfp pilus assembly protein PilO
LRVKNNMDFLSNPKINKLSVPIIIILIIGLVVFVLWPARSNILSTKEDITSERIGLEQQYLNGQLLKKTQEQFMQIESDIPRVKSTILSSGQELFVITTFEEIAQRHSLEQNISMDDLVIDSEADQDKIIALPTRVDLNGNFSDLLRYLADVEALGFYVNWQSISIKSSTGSNSFAPAPGLAPQDIPGLTTSNEILKIVLEGETYWKL